MKDRHDRVSSLIAELAAAYIRREANAFPMITVTRADISSDYRSATIYITTMPAEKEQQALHFLTRHGTDLRRHIMKASNLKIIPRLTFAIDEGERHRQRIDEIAERVRKEEGTEG